MTPAFEYFLNRPLYCTREAIDAVAGVDFTDEQWHALEAKRGVKMDGETAMSRRNGVAVIPVKGILFGQETWLTSLLADLFGGTITAALARDLALAANDPGVHAVLLDVASPGGDIRGIGEFAAMVHAAGKVKPVCAYVGDLGCSAAYWIASAADEVVCAETAQLGSIGVISSIAIKADRPGSKTYTWYSTQSPNKNPDPATDSGSKVYQDRCNALAAVFIRHVAGYRNTTAEAVESDFGRGGVLIGQSAVEAGMADAIGDFESTIARLSRGERLPVRQPMGPKARVAATETQKGRPKMSLYEKLFSRVARDNPKAAADAFAASGGDDDDGLARFSAAFNSPLQPPVDTAKFRAEIRAELEAEAKAKAESDGKVLATLKDFFDGQANAMAVSRVEAGKLRPDDVPAFKALFTELALHDHAGPLTAGDKAIRRAPFLTSLLDGKAGVAWTKEHVGSAEDLGHGRTALPTVTGGSSGDRPKVDQERVLSMLGMTESGRAALAESKFKTA